METTTAKPLPLPEAIEDKFHTTQILQISTAHFIHDSYTGFIPTLLPVLIEKLSLSLTLAGTLTAIMQLPAILTPFIGYFSDRVSLQLLVILAPAVTGTLVSLVGKANSVLGIALLMLAIGFSVACFHAPAPAMVGKIAGRRLGSGMSLFMAGGELGRTIGPILAAWAITMWTIDGIYRFAVVGWFTSIILFLRLRNVSAKSKITGSLSAVIPTFRKLFLPLSIANFFRMFLLISITVYLPTFLKLEGSSLFVAGAALSLLELAGVAGALSSGTLSDTLGRKVVLAGTILLSTLMMYIFLNIDGWLVIPVLLLLGFTALSSTPVMLAMVQEQLPDHRGVANGMFIAMMFLLQSLVIYIIGVLGDHVGLRQVFYWSIFFSLASLPAIFFLPDATKERQEKLNQLSH